MTTLKRAGHTLVFVSHRLEEVFGITDRVTVMREGRTVAKSLATASLSQAELIRLMVGQEMKPILPNRPDRSVGRSPGSVVLEVRNLRSEPAVRDVSFQVHKGEILGLGGLVGAGRSETVEAIFGLRAVLAGMAVGFFSGVLIARFGLPAFVVTLGVMAIGRSLAYILSGASAIADLPDAFGNIVYASIFGVPANVLTLLLLYILAWAYLNFTKGGRTVYAIGSNHGRDFSCRRRSLGDGRFGIPSLSG